MVMAGRESRTSIFLIPDRSHLSPSRVHVETAKFQNRACAPWVTSSAATMIQILLAVLIVCFSFGLGATLCFEDLKEVLRTSKRQVAIGMASQFGFMPLVSYAFAHIFGFSNSVSVGLMLVGIAPGGTTSNLFTYLSKGNVALSIVMSALSTLASFGTMPLLLLVYVETSFTDEQIKIPWATIAVSLLLVIVPVTLGIVLKTKSDKWAKRAEIAGAIIGTAFIIAALVVGIVETDVHKSNWRVWLVGGLMEPIGAAFGYGVSYLLKLHPRDCRTVSLETGVQNSSLAIAIASLSFDGQIRDDVLVFPFMYSFFYCVNSIWIVVLYRYLAKYDPPLPGSQAEAEKNADKELVAMSSTPTSGSGRQSAMV